MKLIFRSAGSVGDIVGFVGSVYYVEEYKIGTKF